jgi:AcrR family transcriptional regulator
VDRRSDTLTSAFADGGKGGNRRTGGAVTVERGQRWQQKRTEVVDIAARLFAAHGYHATGITQLCTAVGLGKGALYYYVESKENLLFLIHERVMEFFLVRGREIAGSGRSAEERLRLLGELQLEAIASYPHHVAVFLHEYKTLTGERAAEFSKSRRQYEKMLERVFQDGVDDGAFEIPDLRLAVLAWLGMYNYTYIWFDAAKGGLAEQAVARRYHDIFVKGIARR